MKPPSTDLLGTIQDAFTSRAAGRGTSFSQNADLLFQERTFAACSSHTAVGFRWLSALLADAQLYITAVGQAVSMSLELGKLPSELGTQELGAAPCFLPLPP